MLKLKFLTYKFDIIHKKCYINNGDYYEIKKKY